MCSLSFQMYWFMCLCWVLFFFLMDNSFSFLSLLVYSQGSDKVRDIPCPEELVFTVDQKIINEIERTKEMYYEKVGFLAAYPDCH